MLFNCFRSYQNISFLFQRNLVIVCKCFCVHFGNFWLTKQLNHKKKQPEDLTERLHLSRLLPTEQLKTNTTTKIAYNIHRETKTLTKYHSNTFPLHDCKKDEHYTILQGVDPKF